MIASLQGQIIANQGIRNAVTNILPLKGDNKLWQGNQYNSDVDEYELGEAYNIDNQLALFFKLPFNIEAERDNQYNALKAVSGLLNNCEDGSYIWLVLCDHDTDNRTGSTIVKKWYKENGQVYEVGS